MVSPRKRPVQIQASLAILSHLSADNLHLEHAGGGLGLYHSLQGCSA